MHSMYAFRRNIIQNICGFPDGKDLNKAYCTLIIPQHRSMRTLGLYFKKVLVWQFFFFINLQREKDKGEGTQSYIHSSKG